MKKVAVDGALRGLVNEDRLVMLEPEYTRAATHGGPTDCNRFIININMFFFESTLVSPSRQYQTGKLTRTRKEICTICPKCIIAEFVVSLNEEGNGTRRQCVVHHLAAQEEILWATGLRDDFVLDGLLLQILGITCWK